MNALVSKWFDEKYGKIQGKNPVANRLVQYIGNSSSAYFLEDAIREINRLQEIVDELTKDQ
jgi:hypothetical protein